MFNLDIDRLKNIEQPEKALPGIKSSAIEGTCWLQFWNLLPDSSVVLDGPLNTILKLLSEIIKYLTGHTIKAQH